MVWFIVILIFLPNHKTIKIREGLYPSQAACEEGLRSMSVLSSRGAIHEYDAYCSNPNSKKEGK